jgi:signal peptidase II
MCASTARREPNDGADASRARPRRGALVVAIVVGVVVVDQLTKTWAVKELADGPVDVFGSDVGFQLSRNSGGAFSVFQGFTPLLAILAVVLSVILVRALHRTDDPLMLVALALLLGGALGNLADRIFRSPGFLRGEVVDFVHVGRFPTFNVADSAITIGAILLVVSVLWSPARDDAAHG